MLFNLLQTPKFNKQVTTKQDLKKENIYIEQRPESQNYDPVSTNTSKKKQRKVGREKGKKKQLILYIAASEP